MPLSFLLISHFQVHLFSILSNFFVTLCFRHSFHIQRLAGLFLIQLNNLCILRGEESGEESIYIYIWFFFVLLFSPFPSFLCSFEVRRFFYHSCFPLPFTGLDVPKSIFLVKTLEILPCFCNRTWLYPSIYRTPE